MKKNMWVKTIVAVASVAVIVVVSFFGPGLAFGVGDKVLFASPHAREEMGNNLSPEGEDNYLVRAVWNLERAAKSGPGQEGAGVYATTYPVEYFDKELVLKDIEQLVSTLVEEMVLPIVALNVAWENLLPEKCEVYRGTNSYGFEEVSAFLVMQNAECNISFKREIKSGKIVEMNLWMPYELELTDEDLAVFMKAYIAYTGMDALDDWEQVLQNWRDLFPELASFMMEPGYYKQEQELVLAEAEDFSKRVNQCLFYSEKARMAVTVRIYRYDNELTLQFGMRAMEDNTQDDMLALMWW